MSHQVSPYVHDPASTKPGERTRDYDRWNRDGAMARIDVNEIMEQWRARKAM
jgi:hypothetical protein